MNPTPSLDPKKEAGAKKTPLHLLPPYALAQTALAHAEGARRYGPWNWRTNQVCATTYIGAILRHLTAWQDGEDIDADSGLSHIAKIGACCNILLDAGHCGTLVDDRSKVPSMSLAEILQALREEDVALRDLTTLPENIQIPEGFHGNPKSFNDPHGVFVEPPPPSSQQRLDEHLKNLDETFKLLAAKWREKDEQQSRKIFNDLVAEHAKRQISEMPNIVIDPTVELEPWMPKPPTNLREDIQRAINCRSAENGSDTPDWILAEYLIGCLETFDKAVTAREAWYDRKPKAVNPPEDLTPDQVKEMMEKTYTVIDPSVEPHGIGKVMAEIEAAVENVPTPSHPPTPCCNYRAELSNTYPVFWNPFNKVVQCHNCGHQYEAVK